MLVAAAVQQMAQVSALVMVVLEVLVAVVPAAVVLTVKIGLAQAQLFMVAAVAAVPIHLQLDQGIKVLFLLDIYLHMQLVQQQVLQA
jgi:hypothetical protein